MDKWIVCGDKIYKRQIRGVELRIYWEDGWWVSSDPDLMYEYPLDAKHLKEAQAEAVRELGLICKAIAVECLPTALGSDFTVPSYVKALRVSHGLSQGQLAALADLSKRTIERVESGHGFRGQTIRLICQALQVPDDEMQHVLSLSGAI